MDFKSKLILALQVPIKLAADNITFFYIFYFHKKCLDILCESSTKHMIQMKCLDLFSMKNKKKTECCLIQVLLGASKVKWMTCGNIILYQINVSTGVQMPMNT